ncbi:MAG: hypothetical protein HC905_07010 [Bacteroidales bacterium]|nr:hypothetical protein [Bacteroidales bacterium]
MIGLALLGFSCQKEYEKEYNWAYPVSGDWTVTVAVGENVLGSIFMKTYNTSFGQDSIWVDDNHNFWPFQVKAKVDVNARTFETTEFVSYEGTNNEDIVTITNAKVVNNDSIYFEIKFDSDPDTYIISGHRRVSYDEYNGIIH